MLVLVPPWENPIVKRCQTDLRNLPQAGCDGGGQELPQGGPSTGLAGHSKRLRLEHWHISSCDSLVTF